MAANGSMKYFRRPLAMVSLFLASTLLLYLISKGMITGPVLQDLASTALSMVSQSLCLVCKLSQDQFPMNTLPSWISQSSKHEIRGLEKRSCMGAFVHKAFWGVLC